MYSQTAWSRKIGRFSSLLLAIAGLMLFSLPSLAQTTISQGSIQGTVTDPSGAVVPNAMVTVTNQATGQATTVKTSSGGTYNSGGLIPGQYTVRVQVKGFQTVQVPLTVQVGVTTAGNVKLQVGETSQVVEVQASDLQVNTEQASVQDVLTGQQIDNLPVNGRNFLDLAQLEPGVQIQDGQNFDPTKAGFSSVSINGVFGRTPRIELDGVDISDETVGTTTQNIALSSIQEFNITRSFLDLSTELTSSGAVNVTTRSGGNDLHGQAFGLFRDKRAGFANFPGGQDLPFQRNQFGGRLGGPIVKNRVFFFADGEHLKQDALAPVVTAAPFGALTGGFTDPFRDSSITGKLDVNISQNVHAFYRYSYNWNRLGATFGFGYSVYNNRDNTPSHAVGLDWTHGSWSNSFRFGYLKFHNEIVDASRSLPSNINPLPNINIAFLDNTFQSGPNLLAPQGTFQSNKQFKYDGSKVQGTHIIRFGFGVNRILGGGFAKFFGTAPQVLGLSSGGPVSGDPSNPANYPFFATVFGNGQGFFTEKQGFGLPAGGQADTRTEAYIGDSWKIKPTFTLTYGMHWGRDTGRSDSDLGTIPCSAVDTTLLSSPALAPCSGSAPLLDQFGAVGAGAPIRQPNTNFGPQLGFAWDPTGSGKTVIRAGAGIYYENSIFNNVLFDRPFKLQKGLFFQDAVLVCGSGAKGDTSFTYPTASGPQTITSIDGLDIGSQVCFQPLSAAAQPMLDLQNLYQSGTASVGASAANPNYVGKTLEISIPNQGLSAYFPNYRTTRSYQMNFGVQRELWRGGILTADYVRNVSDHFMLTVDANHVGDARYLNLAAAQNAIATTNAAFKCAGSFSQAATQCAIANGATITDYASNGLDSGVAYLGGAPASLAGLTPSTGAAFPGINPLMGQGEFQFPIGRSVYNGLQMMYRQNLQHPMPGLSAANLIVSYALSRFSGNGGNDQNFNPTAFDFEQPTKFFGPTALDHLHQLSIGGTVQVARGPMFTFGMHFASAPPSSLFMNTTGSTPQTTTAGIFQTDFTGDGTPGDLFPAFGNPGSFDRQYSASDLPGLIQNYNSSQAGTLTPAGQALVNAGLFTPAEMQQIQAVKPLIVAPPLYSINNAWTRAADLSVGWPIHLSRIRESMVLTPSVSFYNIGNFSNFTRLSNDATGGLVSYYPGQAVPTPSAGTVQGTTTANRDAVRVGMGSGAFAYGSPRQAEFGLRLDF